MTTLTPVCFVYSVITQSGTPLCLVHVYDVSLPSVILNHGSLLSGTLSRGSLPSGTISRGSLPEW